MVYRHAIDAATYVFNDLRDLLAKATPPRSGDRLAGIAGDIVADGRGVPRLAAVGCGHLRRSQTTLARRNAGNGRGGFKADAQSGSHPGGEEMPGDIGLPQHDWAARADERAVAAQPSLR